MLKGLVFVGALFTAYVVYWNYQDQGAQTAAANMCGKLAAGADASGLAALVKSAGGRLLSNATANPQVVFFPGPIFNGFWVEVNVSGGKVVSCKATRQDD